MVDVMLKLCNEFFSKQEWPTQWTEAVYLAICKKGNIKLCETTEPLALSAVQSKYCFEYVRGELNLALKKY